MTSLHFSTECISDRELLNEYQDLKAKYDSIQITQKEFLDEMVRLEHENNEFKKEIKICKDFMASTEREYNYYCQPVTSTSMKQVAEFLKIPYSPGDQTLNLVVDSHNENTPSDFRDSRFGDYHSFRERYNERANQTLVESGFWNDSEPSQDILDPEAQNDSKANKFIQIVEQNEQIKRDMAHTEIQNANLISQSKYNQERISKLISELSRAKTHKAVSDTQHGADTNRKLQLEDVADTTDIAAIRAIEAIGDTDQMQHMQSGEPVQGPKRTCSQPDTARTSARSGKSTSNGRNGWSKQSKPQELSIAKNDHSDTQDASFFDWTKAQDASLCYSESCYVMLLEARCSKPISKDTRAT
ncbi:unnamed protein product [Moneuplotes crassus]|uniref:Uncharacterized protein n=1 Tax=Euplotes crassus TaxID=5936 RepID=A0AAD1X8B6_EUPCR|nr:unnamed protein product [Moneuplotes crassus]